MNPMKEKLLEYIRNNEPIDIGDLSDMYYKESGEIPSEKFDSTVEELIRNGDVIDNDGELTFVKNAKDNVADERLQKAETQVTDPITEKQVTGDMPQAEHPAPRDNNEDESFTEVLGYPLIKRNTVFYGPPGTGKTRIANIIANSLTMGNKNKTINAIRRVTFHQSLTYEDFIEGLKPVLTKEVTSENNSSEINESAGNSKDIGYCIEDGIFKSICFDALEHSDDQFVLIIDELNRGNVSRIFGEIITLIEDSKRSSDFEKDGVTLPYSKKPFAVPKNLRIIATMNTADRSLTPMDNALRRRFDFIKIEAKYPEITETISEGINLRKLMERLNDRLKVLLDEEHTMGYGYFEGIDSLHSLKLVFERTIIPQLEEYFNKDYRKIALVLSSMDPIEDAGYVNNSYFVKEQSNSNLFSPLVEKPSRIPKTLCVTVPDHKEKFISLYEATKQGFDGN